MNNYGYDDGYGANNGVGAAIGVFILLSFLFAFVVYIFCGIAGMTFLKKTGHPNPWAAWIPIYNNWVILEVGKQAGFWALLPIAGGIVSLIPILGPILSFVASIVFLIALIYAFININKSLGHERDVTAWTVFATILTPIWLGVVAWNKDTFDYTRGSNPGPFFLPSVGNQQVHRPYSATGDNYQHQGYDQTYQPNQNGYNSYGQAPQPPQTPQYGQQNYPEQPSQQQPPQGPQGPQGFYDQNSYPPNPEDQGPEAPTEQRN